MMLYVVLVVCVGIAESYPNGQVGESCGSLAPTHRSYSAQSGSPPYTVTADQSSFKEGDEITVTLRAQSGDFEGFLLQARKAGTSSVIGSFTVSSNNAQGLTCSGVSNSAVSHTSDSEKTFIQVKWKAPASGQLGNIEFSATFVKSFETFWVGVKSSVISYNGTSTPATAAPTVPTAVSDCGKSKVCYSQPNNCDPASSSACYFMSVQTSSSQSEMKLEIVGPASGYVAMGFSDDQKMGNDDIYICGKDSGGNLQVQHAVSSGRTAPNILSLGNVSDIKTALTNGILNCTFTSRNPISTGSRAASVNEYFLMIAAGPSSQGNIQFHTNTYVSASKANLLNPAVVETGEEYPAIVKAHGALMLIAWMTTGSIGMLIARYLKAVGRGCCGKDFWFLAHVMLMSLSIVATAIAFILVFSYARDWSGGAHPVLGCLVMILTLIQPVVAALRCDPQHERRFVFNWAHSFIALAIKGLAVAAIFTGLALIGESGGDDWMLKVMGGFVAWEALMYVLQDLNRRSQKKESDICSFGTMSTEVLLLILFILGNLAFLIALLVGIGRA